VVHSHLQQRNRVFSVSSKAIKLDNITVQNDDHPGAKGFFKDKNPLSERIFSGSFVLGASA
jgi:hypothetical protein